MSGRRRCSSCFECGASCGELSENVAVVWTAQNADEADVDAVGQSSEAVMLSAQPTGGTVLISSEEQEHEESDTKGNYFISRTGLDVFVSYFNYYGSNISHVLR